MDEAMLPVKRDVRRSFDRAAATYDDAAILQREVCARLLEHLEPMRIAPRRASMKANGPSGAPPPAALSLSAGRKGRNSAR